MDNLPNKDVKCHRTGFKTSCRKLVADGSCCRWMTIEGEDPQSGIPMTQSMCRDDWPATLLIDVARKIKNGLIGVQAATESSRNEIVTRMDAGAESMLIQQCTAPEKWNKSVTHNEATRRIVSGTASALEDKS